jgi:hypothetical protein
MNPELRRNLWLEFSIERLLIIPAVAVLSMVAITGTIGRPAAIFFVTYGAIAIGIIWGSTLASSSYLGEITARTWDMQRATSLSGWQVTWGKLFGATSYPWYGLAIAFAAWLWLDGPASASRAVWLVLVPSAVLAQAVALVAAVYLALDGRVHARSARQAAVVGVLAGIFALQVSQGLGNPNAPDWYGLAIDRRLVVVGSALFLCMWAVVAAWRSMCMALQIPLRAWAWPTFLVALGAWLAGFISLADPQSLVSRRFYAAFVASWIATWVSALIDTKSPVKLRQWGAAIAGAGRLLARTPAWVIGLPIVIAAGIGIAMTDEQGLGPARLISLSRVLTELLGIPLVANPAWLTVLAALLLLWRDLAIMYWAGLTMGGRRVPALLYLGVLYILVPATLIGLESPMLLPAFLPVPYSTGMFDAAFVVLVIEVVAASALAVHAIAKFTRLVR